MIYCKDNKELHLSGTADLLLAQATAVAISVLKVACAGRKDEMRKEIVEKFVELVVKDVCGEKSKVSDGNCLIKVENGITTMAGNAKDMLYGIRDGLREWKKSDMTWMHAYDMHTRWHNMCGIPEDHPRDEPQQEKGAVPDE